MRLYTCIHNHTACMCNNMCELCVRSESVKTCLHCIIVSPFSICILTRTGKQSSSFKYIIQRCRYTALYKISRVAAPLAPFGRGLRGVDDNNNNNNNIPLPYPPVVYQVTTTNVHVQYTWYNVSQKTCSEHNRV